MAPQRHDRPGQERRGADKREYGGPLRGSTQRRMQAGKQIDARFDHRGRVQIGTGGRRSLHRVRQPEMKRKLRRFCECTGKDQEKYGQAVEQGIFPGPRLLTAATRLRATSGPTE